MYKVGKILGIIGVIINLGALFCGGYLLIAFDGLTLDMLNPLSSVVISLIILRQLIFSNIKNIKSIMLYGILVFCIMFVPKNIVYILSRSSQSGYRVFMNDSYLSFMLRLVDCSYFAPAFFLLICSFICFIVSFIIIRVTYYLS
ncbi:MAG: hypothetical protein ABRQ27_17200 [Clostridiaceae bacterium]